MDKTMTFFSDLFRAAYFSGIIMTDDRGNIIYVDEGFETKYGQSPDDLMGKSVFELEKQGVFRPSSAALVLKTGKEVNLIQTIAGTQKVVVSAFPIYGEGRTISSVITFTRNLEEYIKTKELYEEMALKIHRYEKAMDEMKYETIIIDQFHTKNRNFQQTLKALQRAARYPINILLLGETGVGKTLLAKKIHKLSDYRDGDFVEINCGALPEALIESELFGYEKGSFTGADDHGKKGIFEIANQGTLFLDEISELPLVSQAKLLKVLEDGEFRRIGGTQARKADCRIIAATNKNLDEEVEKGTFRQDLYYRLNTTMFTLPPLRERREDIIPLCNDFLDKAKERFGLERVLDRVVMRILTEYNWPGNVRELENAVFHMAVTSEERVITSTCVPDEILKAIETQAVQEKQVSDLQLALEEFEGDIIRTAFAKYGSSVKVAAALNISQSTAARKIKKYLNEAPAQD